MRRDNRRITLVSRAASAPDRAWLDDRDAPRRLIFVASFGVLPYALAHGVNELGEAIDSVVIDGTARAHPTGPGRLARTGGAGGVRPVRAGGPGDREGVVGGEQFVVGDPQPV